MNINIVTKHCWFISCYGVCREVEQFQQNFGSEQGYQTFWIREEIKRKLIIQKMIWFNFNEPLQQNEIRNGKMAKFCQLIMLMSTVLNKLLILFISNNISL